MLRFVAVIFFIILTYSLIKILGPQDQFTPEYIQLIFKKEIFLASFIYIALFTVGNLLQVPGWVFLAGAVWGIGKAPAYFLTLIAAFISCALGYFIIRFVGKDSLRKINYIWVKKLLLELDKRPLKVNIILRLVFQTVPMLNYSLALSGVKFKDYFLGMLFGLPLPILLYTLFIDEVIKIFR